MFKKVFKEVDSFFGRDPAARSRLEVFLCYPGFHAIVIHRLAHWIWKKRFHTLARFISSVSRFLTGIEIHPGAVIGENLFIDHGSGVVIGETATIGNNVTIYHGVTLGGVAPHKNNKGDIRHPQIEDDVIIGSGANILGAIKVGKGARIGANSVVTAKVDEGALMMGVPARKVDKRRVKAVDDEAFSAYGGLFQGDEDPRQVAIDKLSKQVEELQKELNEMKFSSSNKNNNSNNKNKRDTA